MSLNGLDGTRVKEAHEAAVAEPGGWFLLKYASRDEVELLGRGNGGIVEIRNSIAQYEDKSPLYGFLRYRRRNVIIKYLPEDCSRLIQARVAVHFNAICDRFSPYDTDFSITEPKELKDTKLSAACSLHAASGSTSSSTSSLRRRRLMEIAEEEEEEERERKRQSVVNEEERPKSPLLPTLEPPVQLDADLAKLPEASRFAKDLHPPHFTGVSRPSSPAQSLDETARRISSQSSRHDLYPTTSYPYSKPRVKLAPRPSTDLGRRPRSSAGGAAHRPVATVPAGIKSMSKGPRKGRSQSQSQDEQVPESPIKEQAEDSFPPADAAEFEAKPSDLEVARLHTSSGAQAAAAATSSLNLGPPAIAPPVSKQNTMTPEKARLLKAMKLREKKMMSLQPTLDVPAADIPSAPSPPGTPDGTPDLETPSAGLVGEAPGENDGTQEDLLADSKAEDGVDVGTDDASVDTHTDSPPRSPVAASDVGDSTQASSLSESTDETVLAKDRDGSPEIREDEVSGSEPTASTIQIAAMPSKASTDETEVESSKRQSAATVAAVCENKAERRTATQDSIQHKEPVTSVDVVVAGSLPTPTPSEVSPPTIAPEQEATEVRPAEPLTQPGSRLSAPETTAAEAEPTEEAKPSSPRLRIPLSKFSTRETKSPAGAVSQRIASVATHSSDVDSWRAGESAPPVPEKDDSVEKTRATEASGMSRLKLLGPIRTDVDAPGFEKRRSVISILENDGFMDELQSATVQQATPITVSKSSMSPFFPIDQGSKKAFGGLENAPRFVRTVSNPARSSFLAPGEPSTGGTARSASAGASYLQKISQPQSPADLRPKSAKLGSSISQRIKALEMLSGSAPPVDAAPKERPATTFFAVRKASTREPSRSPSVVDRPSLLTRGASPAPSISGESSPETSRLTRRDRSGSLVDRRSMFEGGMPPRGRPESVQVTARIVRDPNQPFPKAPEPKAGSADYPPLDLKQSPLVVDVQSRASSRSPARPFTSLSACPDAPSQSKRPLLERQLSNQSKDGDKEAEKQGAPQRDNRPRPRRRSSLSIMKGFIKDRTESLVGVTDNLGNSLLPAPPSLGSPARSPSVPQNGWLSRRQSISSRRSSTDQNGPALSAAVPSSARTAEAGGESEVETRSSTGSFEKKSGSGSSGPGSPTQSKGGLASRFMRRLSNTLAGSSRKNAAPAISPTVAEEDAAEVDSASRGSTAHSQPSIVAFMGDVNVQFPDNLLWKRRSICLDSQGFLILSAVQGTAMMAPSGKDRHSTMIKRYHMSDFKPPYAPDVELQELPNSVVLDLVDGSGLQIACEDRAGQMSILHILEEAHQSHTRFGR